MKTEDLKAQGLNEEQIAFVMSEHGKSINTLKGENAALTVERDKYKESLDDVQTKLDAFKGIDVKNVNELQGQISTLTTDLANEKNARAEDARKMELEKNITTFLADKKFVNAITQRSIQAELVAELDKDTAKGKSIEDIFKSLIADTEGNPLENILVDEAQQQLESNKPQFTVPKGNSGSGTITKADFAAMSVDERIKLKTSNPEMYKNLRQ